MAGIIIAFQDYLPASGLFESEWVGFKWFRQFFQSIYFFRLLRNTLLISFYNLIWGFPVPIVFALMLNEAKDGLYKRSVQTISYLPHFISLVIIVGMMADLLASRGIVNQFVVALGGEPVDFMRSNRWFRTLYVGSGIWQSFGWNSIIYLAAMAGIDPQLYEAATVDGARRLQKIWHITLPGIMPTVIILLILNCGRMLAVGAQKIILMYSPVIYQTADVIATYVYRRGILGADYSFAAAVGLFEAVINFSMLVMVNSISKRVSSTSLW
jgi:putative aldouronate transport system permease protein